jgi:hypothetical protein
MKKSSLFFVALSLAVLIAYTKRPNTPKMAIKPAGQWKTFEKKTLGNQDKIIAHTSTEQELAKGNLNRKIASATPPEEKLYLLREERVLTGDNIDKYKDESVNLPMVNKLNPEWKEALGNELLRFQKNDTKIIIKDELQLIKIKEDKGQYMEQVVITYFLKNGDQNSFHALINSETGNIVDTWDRTIHERYRRRPARLEPSSTNNIIGR